MEYQPRILDSVISGALKRFPAIAVDGPKAVGKSATASRLAGSVFRLDNPEELSILRADRGRASSAARPVLLDEWQYDPPIWDHVRREVDHDRAPGRFLLTGSANTNETQIHTGAGRIVRLRMYPMSLEERLLDEPSVSLRRILADTGDDIEGTTSVSLDSYVREIVSSGFPALRNGSSSTIADELDAYLTYALQREVPALGSQFRRPQALLAWLRAYAAATSTTASFESIAAAVSKESRPSRATIGDFREALSQLWLLDEIPAWIPEGGELNKLGNKPKHQLADPALAARLLRATPESLLGNRTRADTSRNYRSLKNGPLLGSLFESLVTLCIRCYVPAFGHQVGHLRTHSGDHEIDLIVEKPDGRVVAIEIKLASEIDDSDVRHLNWLHQKIGDELVDKIIVTSGKFAYRRQDGVAVVPLALLGS